VKTGLKLIAFVCIATASCAAQVDRSSTENASTTNAQAETIAPATLSFGADWSVTQSGALVAGGKATIHYDIARLPYCRTQYMGFPAWDVLADWSVDGGRASSVPVTKIDASGARVGTDVTIDVPYGHDLALWFYESDEGGCAGWDSAYGKNFHFAVDASAPVVHFRSDWSISVDGALAAGADFVVDYDLARLPSCRQTYNGLDTWEISAHGRFDDGSTFDAPLTAIVGSSRVAAPARVRAPSTAHHVDVWFDDTDRTGCHAWDSNYGANFGFDLR